MNDGNYYFDTRVLSHIIMNVNLQGASELISQGCPLFVVGGDFTGEVVDDNGAFKVDH